MSNIIGCAFVNDNSEYNDQRNDPLEQINKKILLDLKKTYPGVHFGYLESCGPNAMTNCIVATKAGRFIYNALRMTRGIYKHQFPHLLLGYLNDPANYSKMVAVREDHLDPSGIMGNRVPQYYPLVAREVCEITAFFEWGADFEKIKGKVITGMPVQICLKNPGHYLAVIGYDQAADELVTVDSWPDRTGIGFGGRLKRSEMDNVQPWLVWYNLL
jgi:hypothetical protein